MTAAIKKELAAPRGDRMVTAQDATLMGQRAQAGGSKGYLVGLAMSLLVAVAAFIAFSPRQAPDFPETAIHPDRLLINGLAHAGNRLAAVGELGEILVSEDNGVSWISATVTPQRGSTLTQVLFLDDKLGWAVGHDSWVLRTDDGGKTWEEVHFEDEGSEPLLNLAATTEGNVIAVGSFGRLIKSKDRGRAWEVVDTKLGDRHLYAVAAADGQRLMLAGEGGLLARSVDGGVTWEKMPSIYAGSFFGVMNLGGDEWIAYGMRGNVYRSSDFGNSWTKAETGVEASLFGGTVLPDRRIALVGQGGVVVASSDHGKTFQVIRPGGRRSLATAIDDGQGNLLTGGESGVQKESLTPLKSPENS